MPDDILLFGSFYSLKAENRPRIVKLLTEASHRDCILMYDPNFRKPHLKELESVKPSILENIKISDIVRGSAEDFGNIFQTGDPELIYQNIVTCGGKILILTQGDNEVFLFTGTIRKSYSVPEVQTVSTIGAGDNFNAGLIFEMIHDGISQKDLQTLEEKDWDKLISTAITFASHVCCEKENYISHGFVTKLQSLPCHHE
jgi:fructokinase